MAVSHGAPLPWEPRVVHPRRVQRFGRIFRAAKALFLLDYNGVVADMDDDPRDTRVDNRTLTHACALLPFCEIAILSGESPATIYNAIRRCVESSGPRQALLPVDDIEINGVLGAAWRYQGVTRIQDDLLKYRSAMQSAEAMIRAECAQRGFDPWYAYVEAKEMGVSVRCRPLAAATAAAASGDRWFVGERDGAGRFAPSSLYFCGDPDVKGTTRDVMGRLAFNGLLESWVQAQVWDRSRGTGLRDEYARPPRPRHLDCAGIDV